MGTGSGDSSPLPDFCLLEADMQYSIKDMIRRSSEISDANLNISNEIVSRIIGKYYFDIISLAETITISINMKLKEVSNGGFLTLFGYGYKCGRDDLANIVLTDEVNKSIKRLHGIVSSGSTYYDADDLYDDIKKVLEALDAVNNRQER